LAVLENPGLRDGDVVSATVFGNTIAAYINSLEVARANDGTFTDGNPGMGFDLSGVRRANADYGFTTLTTSDGGFPLSMMIIQWSSGAGTITSAVSPVRSES